MKKVRVLFLLFLIVCLTASCSRKNNVLVTDDDVFYLYFLDQTKKELHPVEAVMDVSDDLGAMIQAVYQSLDTPEDDAGYLSVIPDTVDLDSFTIDDHNLVLNYGAAYYDMDDVTELLMRAALVKTFTQFDQITTVEIRVDSQPLVLPDGTLTGPERNRNFVDIISTGINAYTRGTIVLYFANPEGTGLVENTMNVAYQNSNPLEKYVLQRLILGPQDESQGFATLPSNTKILSVSTKDGICQVDLNDELLKETILLKPEVIIYSIVNSLTEVSGVTGVQISVNGSSNIMFMDEISLAQVFVKNVNLMEGENED